MSDLGDPSLEYNEVSDKTTVHQSVVLGPLMDRGFGAVGCEVFLHSKAVDYGDLNCTSVRWNWRRRELLCVCASGRIKIYLEFSPNSM